MSVWIWQPELRAGRRADRKSGRKTDRWADRQSDRLTGREPDRQAGCQTDKETDKRRKRSLWWINFMNWQFVSKLLFKAFNDSVCVCVVCLCMCVWVSFLWANRNTGALWECLRGFPTVLLTSDRGDDAPLKTQATGEACAQVCDVTRSRQPIRVRARQQGFCFASPECHCDDGGLRNRVCF